LRRLSADAILQRLATIGRRRPAAGHVSRLSHPEGAGERMQSQTLKIEHARYVLTLDGGRRIIQDGTILVDGARISRVGKAGELADVPAGRVIDARHFVVIPGFVNGHMHISYAHAVRGIFLDDLGSPLPYVFRLQMAMTEDEEYHTTLLGLVELLRNGTSCFVDPGSTKFPDACLQAYEDAGIRVILGECVSDQDAPFPLPRYGTEDALARTASFVRQWDGRLRGRIRAWAMPFSPETCSVELLRGAKRVADELGTGLTLHHGSGEAARRASLARHGLRPTEYLEANAVLGPNVLLSHALGLDEAELACLARSGAAVTMCPVTAAKGARGVPEHGRMPELLQRGVRVALGSDSPNNSNHLDMVRTMNMAAIQYKDARQDMRQIPAEQALEMATLLGAQALGLGDALGSIEPGKCADLVCFDTRRPEWQALFNPVNNLVYNADGRSVHTVIVDGRVVIDGYRQTFVDEERLFARVQEIGERLLARTGVALPRSRWPIV
jgi:cytosine/adenosine deaminase-related metal-dependent hydrolase